MTNGLISEIEKVTDYDKVFLKLKRFKDLNFDFFEEKFDATRDLNLMFDKWSDQ